MTIKCYDKDVKKFYKHFTSFNKKIVKNWWGFNETWNEICSIGKTLDVYAIYGYGWNLFLFKCLFYSMPYFFSEMLIHIGWLTASAIVVG